MAIPSTPTNYFLQQANAQCYVLWDITATATSYQVQRSTNGTSYTIIASPTVNYYLDTTVTAGTLYYYQVAATNSDGTSSYTAAQQIVPTRSGLLSLQQTRIMSQLKADRYNSNFVTLPEWNMFINQSLFELYDLLTTTYEDYNVATPYSITTDGNYLYDLPTDFYKLIGVDLGLSGANSQWITLHRFNFESRNRWALPQVTTAASGIANLQYKVLGSKLMLIPTPGSGQYLRLWYTPRLTMLLQETDMMDGISGWSQYVITRVAKYALDKEESDTSKLDAELLFLKTRIEETAQNRDASEPATISDTRQDFTDGYYGPNGNWGVGGWN